MRKELAREVVKTLVGDREAHIVNAAVDQRGVWVTVRVHVPNRELKEST